jgi:hypothetical protein
VAPIATGNHVGLAVAINVRSSNAFVGIKRQLDDFEPQP